MPDRSVLDVDRIERWLSDRVSSLRGPLQVSQVSGGNSNLTFVLSDQDGRRWVLRRPPTGQTLETAHDMAREFRAQRALQGSAVAVPRMVGLAADVMDVPFYVMGFVDGLILRTAQDVEKLLPPAARPRACEQLVDGLVALHAVEPESVGLGRHGRPDAYIERQLERWHRQWEMTPGRRPLPLVDELHHELSRRRPEQSRSTIVHGDYRLDNTVVDASGSVLAVLDWELSTLGDPLADIGTMLAHWVDVGHGSPTAVDGFWGPEDVGAEYAAKTGVDPHHLSYYRAFAHWRLACICEGVYVRYRDGAMGGDAIDLDQYAGMTAGHAHHARELLDTSG